MGWGETIIHHAGSALENLAQDLAGRGSYREGIGVNWAGDGSVLYVDCAFEVVVGAAFGGGVTDIFAGARKQYMRCWGGVELNSSRENRMTDL